MGRDKIIDHKIAYWIVSIVSLLALVGVGGSGIASTSNGAFTFTWRWFGAFIIAGIIANIAIFVLTVTKASSRKAAFYWFATLPVANAAFLLLVLAVVLSDTPQASAYWQSMLPMAWLTTPVIVAFFTFCFVDDKDMPFRLAPWILVLASLAVMIYFAGSSNAIESHHALKDAELTYYGYRHEPGTMLTLVFLWTAMLCFASLGVVIRAYRRATNETLKQQLKIFRNGFIFYFSFALGADLLIYAIFPSLLPPMSFLYTTGFAGFVSYGLLKYGIFQINPAALADQILENLAEAVIGVNGEYKIEFANNGALTIFGRKPAELKGRPLRSLFGESVYADIMEKISASPESVAIDQAKVLHQGGMNMSVAVTVSSIHNDRNEIVGHIFVFQNITELEKKTIELAHEKESVERKVVARTKELHDERARLSASIESLALGFVLLDSKNNIITQNHMVQKILGVSEPIQTADDLTKRMHGFDVAEYCADIRSGKRKAKAEEVAYDEKILRVFATPVVTSENDKSTMIGTVILIEDITEIKVLERSRDEFFSIASHELRTPLTAIRGNASMALQYYADDLKDKPLREIVTDIHGSSVRLIEIVNDFLDMSKLEQGKMSFRYEACALDKLIESVLYELKGTMNESRVHVEYDGATLGALPKVWADPARLKQVIYNLVGNAVKYTEDGTIKLTTSVKDGKVHVSVADTGRGIPLEMRKFLFRKFQQAGNSLLTRDTTRVPVLGYISQNS